MVIIAPVASGQPKSTPDTRNTRAVWGSSSIGRAPRSHRGGCRFEPDLLHSPIHPRPIVGGVVFGLESHPMSRTPATQDPIETSPDQTAESAPPDDSHLTPAMRQYARFKRQHPNCVLFFRMGDFYEMFNEDAVLCHRVLGITLTERTKGTPMAGVPHHAAESYVRRMIEQGHRVAICEQVEDPKTAKGVVRRAVTRVMTPGTLVDESLLDEGRNNEIAAIRFTDAGDDSAAVIALAELSTGRLTLHSLPAGRVADEVARLGPSELLYVETADGNIPPRVKQITTVHECALTPRPAWMFRHRDAFDCLASHFGVTTLAGFGLRDDDEAIGPAGALLRYLQETQDAHEGEDAHDPDDPATQQRASVLRHIRPPRRLQEDAHVVIDATSLRSLEIERTMRTGANEGSVLWALQRGRTPMGKRLLREWLCFPIRDLQTIHTRQRAVSALVEDREAADMLGRHLGRVQDVARIAGRIAMRRATPRDVVAMGRSVSELNALVDLLDGRPALGTIHAHLASLVDHLTPLADRIATACIDSPPAHLREGGLFRDGVDAALDESRGLQRDANAWLAAYQQQLVRETAIPSLKVGYNKVFGYYIEITHAHRAKAPDSFTRKQTLKNAERYITPELKDFEEKVTSAESRAIEREQHLFAVLCEQVAERQRELGQYADAVAELDVLTGLAETAFRFGYTRPTVVAEPVLDIRQGRHIVLDQTLGKSFVPNDCQLGHEQPAASPDEDADTATSADAGRIALITGPNMAGKSTYIRQVALIVLLAHTGSFVPAEHAVIGVTDRIFTRIGASDELHAGQSTFMVEMTETANILHHATEHSIVILDEIGRGTSTLDGLSLAWAIAETLSTIACRTLFATHYHELTTLAEQRDNVKNLHVAVREWGEEIIFLYRILPGRTDRSYGIHVARIAGLPSETVQRAQAILDSLAVETGHAVTPPPTTRTGEAQMSLFTEYVDHPALGMLRQVKLEQLTPMEAFDRLRTLRAMLNDTTQGG